MHEDEQQQSDQVEQEKEEVDQQQEEEVCSDSDEDVAAQLASKQRALQQKTQGMHYAVYV